MLQPIPKALWLELLLLFSHSVVASSLRPHGLQHARLPCPLSPWLCSNLCPLSQWCHPTILCHPLLLLPSILPSIRVFSHESALCIRWPKYWSFSFSISPSNVYSGLISFRIGWLDLLAVQGTLKSLLQHHDLKALILQRLAFFMIQLSHPYMTTSLVMCNTISTPTQLFSTFFHYQIGKLWLFYYPATHLSITLDREILIHQFNHS